MAATFIYRGKVKVTEDPPQGEAAQDIRQNFMTLTDSMVDAENKLQTVEERIEVVEESLTWKLK